MPRSKRSGQRSDGVRRRDGRGPELVADGGTDFGDADLDGPTSVPSDAVAVDVACPHCGNKPIESVAKGYRVTGMLLVTHRKTLRVVGCQSCIRKKLLVAAGKNLVLGWWGVRAFVTNVFAIPWNVLRAFVSRGPNANLVDTLEDADLDFEFVAADEEWDPVDRDTRELYLDGMVRLGCAVMEADGVVSESERQIVLAAVGQLFPDHPTDEVAEMVDRYSGARVDVGEVSRGIAPVLTDEGREMVLRFVLAVANADDELDASEAELLGEVASGLGLSRDQVEGMAGS